MVNAITWRLAGPARGTGLSPTRSARVGLWFVGLLLALAGAARAESAAELDE